MKHGERELFLAEGTAESGCVYDPSKRRVFSDTSTLIDYIVENTLNKKKIGFNLDLALPQDLEEKIRQYRPKTVFQRVEFKRKAPPTHFA